MKKIPAETSKFFENDKLRTRVFVEKYAAKTADGNLKEKTPRELWDRVAREISSVEKPEHRAKIEKDFRWALQDFKFS